MKTTFRKAGLNYNFTRVFIFLSLPLISFGQKKILFFASYENTYYSEYVVAIEALKSSGCIVDVRTAGLDSISSYMLPTGTTIDATAGSLAGSSYADFTSQFSQNFGSNWDASLNSTPAYVFSNGSILDIATMDGYDALVIAGGTGILDYRVDGSYASSGTGSRMISAATMEMIAEHLNALAINALDFGKPVLAQCHAASLPVFWRIPITEGSGSETLGISLLKGQQVAGYPDAATTSDYGSVFVNHALSNPVMISSPNDTFPNVWNGTSKIITSRDWYPQTVSYAVRTLLNVLESYPTVPELQQSYKVLILHGGAVNPLDCSPTNRANDVPCNHGVGTDLPADYTDLQALLSSDSPIDFYSFQVSQLNLTDATLPFSPTNKVQVLNYLRKFDVVLFFKHWSTGITTEIQDAIKSYLDNGGGLVGLHHALYNDIDGTKTKDILVNQVFGAESEMSTWSANLTSYQVYGTNYGHFVSSYFNPYSASATAPANWSLNALPIGSSTGFSELPQFTVYDEIYNNMTFLPGQLFGRNVNEITPLFSNNADPASQGHTTGFVKLFNTNFDLNVGRLAYFEIGERKENLQLDQSYGQLMRNAVVWSAKNRLSAVVGIEELEERIGLRCYPNPANDEVNLEFNETQLLENIKFTSLSGKTEYIYPTFNGKTIVLDTKQLHSGAYFLSFETNGNLHHKLIVIQ